MTHLFSSLLVAGGFCLLAAPASGQSAPPLAVGQPGDLYQVFSPAKNILGPPFTTSSVTSILDSLDVDQDGRTDLQFLTIKVQSRSGYLSAMSTIRLANPNLQVALGNTEMVGALAPGTILQQSFTLPAGFASSGWAGGIPRRTNYHLVVFSAGGGFSTYGMFHSGANYMAIRLKDGNTWRYGWLRINMISATGAHYQVEAYALQAAATPLPVLPAQAAAAWQVYPLPATESLTIQAPAAGPGRATLLDDLGRAVSPAVELASGRTAQLDVAGLPPGLYLLRVQTPTGSFVRRVAKR